MQNIINRSVVCEKFVALHPRRMTVYLLQYLLFFLFFFCFVAFQEFAVLQSPIRPF